MIRDITRETWAVIPHMSIEEGMLIEGYALHPCVTDMLDGSFRLSKGFSPLSLVWTSGLSFQSYGGAMMTEDESMKTYRSQSISLYTQAFARPSRHSDFLYRLEYGTTSMSEIGVRVRSLKQTAEINATIFDRLRVEVVAKHFYNEVTAAKRKNFFLADLHLVYHLPGKQELSLSLDNIFDERLYSIRSIGDLSDTNTSTSLRPRRLMISYFIHF